jgi:hypothetical protein
LKRLRTKISVVSPPGKSHVAIRQQSVHDVAKHRHQSASLGGDFSRAAILS